MEMFSTPWWSALLAIILIDLQRGIVARPAEPTAT